MNNFSKFMIGALSLGLFACSSDEPVADINAPAASEGDVFAALTLNLATRSETVDPEDSEHGTEVGTLAENNVDKVIVVLASKNDADYDYITAAYAESARNNIATEPTYVVRFESQALAAHENENVYVFAYCNPKANVVDTFFDLEEGSYKAKASVASFQDQVLKNAEGNIWGDNQFLMTNYEVYSKTIPSVETLTTVYNKQENPFDLGEVTVQRVAARFDIGQKPAADGLSANTYAITDPVDGQNVANVTIDGVALFNEATEFYAFRHSSADGTPTSWNLCGKDVPGMYIVSPFWQSMQSGVGDWMASAYVDGLYATSTSIKAPQSYNYTLLADLTGNDNRDDVNDFNAGFNPWRYTTPNTIPAALTGANGNINPAQIKGATTGVIYRGFITATDVNSKLKEAMENGNVIYAFDGVLYGNISMLADYVKTHPESAVQRAFEAAFGTEENPSDLTSTKGGFTIYRPATDGKYYVYYYYYNQHNNRPDDTLYPMEFGVVRNNVYKLTVNNIYEFGHPGDPGDDPTPEKPEDPDEEKKAYFKVSVRVLPWVVRINNIEF